MDDGIRDLLGAWAVDALDDLERAAVERALGADPELAAEARSLRETVVRLTERDAQAPPPELRQAVLERIASVEQAGAAGRRRGESARDEVARHSDGAAGNRLHRDRHASSVSRRRRSLRVLAAAAALVVAVGIPTGVAIVQYQRAEQAQEQADLLAEAITRPGAQLVSSPVEHGGQAVAVLAESMAVLVVHGIPELHDGDYQLWVVRDGHAQSAGVLAWHDGRLEAQVEEFGAGAALALTAEPMGGSDQPSSDPLVVLAAAERG